MTQTEPRLVLIVADNVSSRLWLKVFSYKFLEAGDGVEAVEVFKTRQPDLILMNVNLPGMDGFQAAGAIK